MASDPGLELQPTARIAIEVKTIIWQKNIFITTATPSLFMA
jgi:hypothetical protein